MHTRLGGSSTRHEQATQAGLAKKLADILGYAVAGEAGPAKCGSGRVYLLPGDTLVGAEAAQLGVGTEWDLFGGVVPHAFIGTKAITHPLVEPDAAAPAGWSHAFGQEVGGSVLGGYTAFSGADARRAGLKLLRDGPVRVKTVCARAGLGQRKVDSVAELDTALAEVDQGVLSTDGIVLEQNLTDVTTFSVGQVRVAELTATYYGTQRLTRDHQGREVYGGSSLTVARGDFEDLVRSIGSEEVRVAVEQARVYDCAAQACFPGFFASRRNYDVARGRDAAGRWRSGVLEQSWRAGGASGAELAALEMFQADPALHAIRAETIELYGTGHTPPPDATVYFDGIDESVGPMMKYAIVRHHDDSK